MNDIDRFARNAGPVTEIPNARLVELDTLLAREIPKAQALHAAIRKERKRRAKRAAA